MSPQYCSIHPHKYQNLLHIHLYLQMLKCKFKILKVHKTQDKETLHNTCLFELCNQSSKKYICTICQCICNTRFIILSSSSCCQPGTNDGAKTPEGLTTHQKSHMTLCYVTLTRPSFVCIQRGMNINLLCLSVCN